MSTLLEVKQEHWLPSNQHPLSRPTDCSFTEILAAFTEDEFEPALSAASATPETVRSFHRELLISQSAAVKKAFLELDLTLDAFPTKCIDALSRRTVLGEQIEKFLLSEKREQKHAALIFIAKYSSKNSHWVQLLVRTTLDLDADRETVWIGIRAMLFLAGHSGPKTIVPEIFHFVRLWCLESPFAGSFLGQPTYRASERAALLLGTMAHWNPEQSSVIANWVIQESGRNNDRISQAFRMRVVKHFKQQKDSLKPAILARLAEGLRADSLDLILLLAELSPVSPDELEAICAFLKSNRDAHTPALTEAIVYLISRSGESAATQLDKLFWLVAFQDGYAVEDTNFLGLTPIPYTEAYFGAFLPTHYQQAVRLSTPQCIGYAVANLAHSNLPCFERALAIAKECILVIHEIPRTGRACLALILELILRVAQISGATESADIQELKGEYLLYIFQEDEREIYSWVLEAADKWKGS